MADALRPKDWDSYIGQPALKSRLQVSIDSALQQGRPLGHVLLHAKPGYGKGHPHGTGILTPDGWSNIENLSVGDVVIGSNGKATELTGVFHRGVLDTYRVSFSDGSSVECDGDHIWLAKTQQGGYKQYTVSELLALDSLRVAPSKGKKHAAFRFGIPMVEPVRFTPQDVEIHPYLMGALLANGNLKQAIITTNDEQIIKECENVAPNWATFVEYSSNPARRYRINDYDGGHKVNRLLDALRSYDLFGVKSREKFIPQQYIYNSIENRVALLRGMMDCDGCQAGSHTSYSSYSKALALGVQELVQSLGGTAHLDDIWREEDDCFEYRVFINLKSIAPFHLKRKLDPWTTASNKKGVYQPFRKICSIDKVDRQEIICLQVAAEDQLYVTESYIVTHNTSLATLIAQEMLSNLTLKVCPVPMKLLYALFMEVGDVIVLDEIHRFKIKEQEALLCVLEDGMIQFENGTFQPIPKPFTVVGATTELKKIIKPLRDRFTLVPKFQDYSDAEMAQIITSMSSRLGLDMNSDNARKLGIASAGVPRQARKLALACRDLGTTDAAKVLHFSEITPEGFTEDHINYLEALRKLNGQAGVEIMSHYLNLPKDVLLDLEHLLVNRNCIEYSPKGRALLLGGLQVIEKYT